MDASKAHVSTLARMRSTRSLSDTQKKEALVRDPTFKIPPHWEGPTMGGPIGVLARWAFRSLCTCAYGQPDLKHMWASIMLAQQGDEAPWDEGRKRASEQLNNILVLAGLLLATSSVFITTPPPDPNFINYTRRGPYLCICGAFGLLLGGIILTSICVVVTSKITPLYIWKVLFRDTLRMYLSLFVIAYPVLCTSAATLVLAFGVLAGIWTAEDLGFKLGAIVIVGLPFFVGFLFAFSSIGARRLIREATEKYETTEVV